MDENCDELMYREALLKELGDIRGLFKMPDDNDPLDPYWLDAMSDPLSVKAYVEAQLAALEAERDAYKAQSNLFKHMVITCGVAATHPDANLTRTGAYAEEWNSAQAEQVRTLRAERDALRKEAERYRWLDDNRSTEVWNHAMSDVEKASAETLSDAIDAAIAAKEPANGQG